MADKTNLSLKLRSGDTNVYLIGKCEQKIKGVKLPSKQQVLQCFFYYVRCVKKTVAESSRLVLDEVVPFWEKARIPTPDKRTCAAKVIKLYEEWRTVQKGCKSSSQSYRKRENEFKESLNNLFDIAHVDALELINIQEDREFLLKQREKGRVGCMTSVDQNITQREKRKAQRLEDELRRKENHEKKQKTSDLSMENFEVESNNTEDEEQDMDVEQAESIPRSSNKPNKKPRKKHFIDERMLACMDAGNMSSPLAIRFISATAKALGHNIEDLVLNCTSLRKQRKEYRRRHGKEIIENFKIPQTFVLHWDGKLLPAIAGKERVERLAIVLTSANIEKLIAIPIIEVGTGAAVAQSVYDYLLKMNMLNSLEMISFDTTAANTGPYNGAAALLESKLDRSLLWLPCRHHIAEVILRAVFENNFGNSSGPEVGIFERFAREWTTFNTKGYCTCMQDECILSVISVEEREKCKQFCLEYLAKVHIRHDYRELLQLALIFLGGGIPNFKFRAPGATSHARFMSKAIYSLKIYIFHEHFKMSSSQFNGIRHMCIFLVTIYIPYWFTASNAVEAPNRDMELIKGIIGYFDQKISTVLLGKIRNHLWYLSEEAVALAFFDPHVDSEIKKKMVLALQIQYNEDIHIIDDVAVPPPKKVSASVDALKLFESKDLSCFVTTKTKLFFSRLEISMDFLILDPSNWPQNEAFCKGEQIAKSISVVNDAAERKVKLITDFNRSLTHNEEDKQYLLHIVEGYRKDFPSYTKSSLL